MPVTRPTELPRWATSAPTTGPGTSVSATVTTPNEGRKDYGWGRGESPPAGITQWLLLTTYRALEWLFDVWGETSAGGPVTTTRDLSAASLTTAGALSSASAAVSGNATVGGTLGVTGASTFTGAATLNGGATVASGQTLTLSGATVTGGAFGSTSLLSPDIESPAINSGGALSGDFTLSSASTFTLGTGSHIDYVSPRSGEIFLHAFELTPATSTPAVTPVVNSASLTNGIESYVTSPDVAVTSSYYAATLRLPAGASVTDVLLLCANASASNNTSFKVGIKAMAFGAGDFTATNIVDIANPIAIGTSAGKTWRFLDLTATTSVGSGQLQVLVNTACSSGAGNLKIYAMRIGYTVPRLSI